MRKNFKGRLKRKRIKKKQKDKDERRRTVFMSSGSNRRFKSACDKNSKRNKKKRIKQRLWRRLRGRCRNRKSKRKNVIKKRLLLLEIKGIQLLSKCSNSKFLQLSNQLIHNSLLNILHSKWNDWAYSSSPNIVLVNSKFRCKKWRLLKWDLLSQWFRLNSKEKFLN